MTNWLINWLKGLSITCKWLIPIGGVFGNFLFLLGSILFLSSATEKAGVWLFICGSGLMLLSSLTSLISKHLHPEKTGAKLKLSQRRSQTNKTNYQRIMRSGTRIASSVGDRRSTA